MNTYVQRDEMKVLEAEFNSGVDQRSSEVESLNLSKIKTFEYDLYS